VAAAERICERTAVISHQSESTDQRLRLIAAETAQRKKQSWPAWGTGILGSPPIQRLMLPLASHQHFVNVHVTNVRGPGTPLYLAGARILSAFPVVPLSGNVTIGIGVLSYAGHLNISVIADSDGCPDLSVFMSGLSNSLSELVELSAG
jgi:diacylglycerol O-acyltransferase / wax synthase